MSTKVLVVDDSPTIRRVVSSILQGQGYETSCADNGETALAQLRQQPVDLVLTDFVMPRMNGYQFCREVREDATLRDLPIVLMSAKGDKIRGQFVEQTGAIDAITKPFDPLGLLAVIEGALRRGEAARSRGDHPPPTEPDAPSSGEDTLQDFAYGSIELSSDPAVRRQQVAQHFTVAVAKLLRPRLDELSTAAPSTIEGVAEILNRSITPEKLGALSAFLHVLDFGDDAAQVLSGDLSFISIAEVLQLLELQRQTGALRVAKGEAEITLFLREGRLDFASSRGLPATFRLGRYLVATGAIDRPRLAQYLANRAASTRLIGDALVRLGSVTEAQVTRALHMQTSELVYEVVGWAEGRFVFVHEATSPEATLAQLALAPGGIVMEGFRRVDEWRLIEGSFDFDEVLHCDQVALDRLSDGSERTFVERAVLGLIDGTRTVRQIVDAVDASTFDTCKTLYQFLNSRIVRRRAA